MPRKALADVWELPCPKCRVSAGEACLDLRGHRRLFGRRTHAERAKAIKALKEAKQDVEYIRRTINVPVPTDRWLTLSSTSTTTGGTAMTWYNAVQAETWYRWTNTTGTASSSWIVTDEQREQAWINWQPYTVQEVEVEVYRRQMADLEQQRREAESRRALIRAQEERRAEDRIVAHSRALDLLRMILSPAQQVEMRDQRRITIEAPSGRRYRVETHRETVHGNIVEIDEHGCPLQRGCVAPGMYESGDRYHALPTPDGWVGQVLAIRHNEEELRRKANWSHIQHCQQPNVPILGRAA